MVIPSIDIKNGKVVQLKGGAELVLERDDPFKLADEFDVYGETAVIDLDAAMGLGNNAHIIEKILRRTSCRVGGGVKTPEDAARWISLGAEKIIVGSAIYRLENGDLGVNIPLLRSFAAKIGRERLIAAVDSRGGFVTVDGWKTNTGLELIQTAAAIAPFAGGLLWTCVDREGAMTGAAIETAKELRTAVSSCDITIAGGVSQTAEIAALARAGCDVQLGMALYTGKVNMAEAFIASLNWEKTDGMIPVVAQSPDGQILMTAFSDAEALAETFKRGFLCFHSRTRNSLWMKGETSGSTLRLVRFRADCDRDALLAVVEPAGAVCHTGGWSCFETSRRYTLQYLEKVIKSRLESGENGSYTASLTDERVRRKIMEEAYEVCTAKTREEVVWEVADLLYHTEVLMAKEGVFMDEVLSELDRRHKKQGLSK
ncbi:MAG: bifunctional phosphoribosyl-AMP cyclohydrolase/phosphoribosyl-ATP diphosphatase HisIE [Spirochaetaceae bacterium]|jgi:phosphoribosyl-ATP pyrophosphohydrolase/phosphoribosyl-AMP cyclohydrolase|nr:bifunctional phosphoribosyl-AMP cyclohydrolase/phosphoribosyl-ATP diphosphatase HisIE [Spirochaetaceae bacterium]